MLDHFKNTLSYIYASPIFQERIRERERKNKYHFAFNLK